MGWAPGLVVRSLSFFGRAVARGIDFISFLESLTSRTLGGEVFVTWSALFRGVGVLGLLGCGADFCGAPGRDESGAGRFGAELPSPDSERSFFGMGTPEKIDEMSL
jgi:hypothetical protein